MPIREIQVVIRGRPGSGAFNAAYTSAQALKAAGASVDLMSPIAQSELAADTLSGVCALMKVEGGGADAIIEPMPLLSCATTVRRTGLSDITKIGLGVLLPMLLGAELRLRFGFRLDMIVTLAGIWAFWHYCLRRPVIARIREKPPPRFPIVDVICLYDKLDFVNIWTDNQRMKSDG